MGGKSTYIRSVSHGTVFSINIRIGICGLISNETTDIKRPNDRN